MKSSLLSLLSAIVAGSLVAGAAAADATFAPLAAADGSFDSERNTGEWFCPDLGSAADIVPLKTRRYATRESVTGGVGMKLVFDPGSTGVIAYEKNGAVPDSAGITFYAKASKPLRFRVCTNKNQQVTSSVAVTTEWAKHDIPWSQIPTDGMWQLIFQVVDPITERTTLYIDRIGTEGPAFDPKPAIDPRTGADQTISSKEILHGAEHLAKTLARLKAKQPFKIVALGDSISAGAQSNRGTWGVKIEDGVPFRYFGHVARLLEQHHGYTGITPVAVAHGGWTTKQLLAIVDTELMPQLTADDLVVLQSGGNDINGGATPAQWKADLAEVIAKVKTKTDQILVVSTAVSHPGPVYDQAEAIGATLREIVAEHKVGGADVTRLFTYRGPEFSSGLLANPYHPDFMGHIMIGRMIAPILTGTHVEFPEE
ncbi:MAG TPA: SGNH/GDSL hydrolase family protein [Planctomycetota bacterium]|nr:SGNH/GDSL hydrolase family protein [Planctomycetota bacterium]